MLRKIEKESKPAVKPPGYLATEKGQNRREIGQVTPHEEQTRLMITKLYKMQPPTEFKPRDFVPLIYDPALKKLETKHDLSPNTKLRFL
jgi:hypothetical protein